MPEEQSYMKQALALATRGQGCVEPNPMVGAVVVRDGQVIGQGYHQAFGQAHAEVQALADCRQAGHDPAGSTVYVSLEPCCHQGKTPPCTKALIAAKVAKVVAAMVDPFPQVAGQGLEALRQAGIDTEVGLLEEEARQLIEPFAKRVKSGLPWVIGKWAQSVDGRIAAAGGDSKWISSPGSRKQVHELRGRVDAIMVGIGTALADDPLLTAREVAVKRVARRVVVDPRLRLPMTARLLTSLELAPLTVAIAQATLTKDQDKVRQLRARGVEVLGLNPVAGAPESSPRPALDMAPLLEHLSRQHQATNVLVEGGGTLLGHLLGQGLMDQLLVFVAPLVIGDDAAVPAIRGLRCSKTDQALTLERRNVQSIEGDVLLEYRVTYRVQPV